MNETVNATMIGQARLVALADHAVLHQAVTRDRGEMEWLKVDATERNSALEMIRRAIATTKRESR